MIQVLEGVVRDNVVVLDDTGRLPEGVKVQVCVESLPAASTDDKGQDPFEALLRRSAAYAGRQLGMDEIIAEEKLAREERFDS